MPQWWLASKSWCSPVSSWSPCWPRWWRDWCICWTMCTFSPGQAWTAGLCALPKTLSYQITHAFAYAVAHSFTRVRLHWFVEDCESVRCCDRSALYADSEYFRESIRHEIRMARERFSGQALSEELGRIQKRLDSVDLLTPDIVMNLLLSYRDIQVCVYVCVYVCVLG